MPAPSTWAPPSVCRSGEPARALEWAGRALAMDPEEPVTLYNVACVYALQGQIEPALDCLENALKHGFAHKEWIEHDSDLTSLHGHPRYQALLLALSQHPSMNVRCGQAKDEGAPPNNRAEPSSYMWSRIQTREL